MIKYDNNTVYTLRYINNMNTWQCQVLYLYRAKHKHMYYV